MGEAETAWKGRALSLSFVWGIAPAPSSALLPPGEDRRSTSLLSRALAGPRSAGVAFSSIFFVISPISVFTLLLTAYSWCPHRMTEAPLTPDSPALSGLTPVLISAVPRRATLVNRVFAVCRDVPEFVLTLSRLIKTKNVCPDLRKTLWWMARVYGEVPWLENYRVLKVWGCWSHPCRFPSGICPFSKKCICYEDDFPSCIDLTSSVVYMKSLIEITLPLCKMYREVLDMSQGSSE